MRSEAFGFGQLLMQAKNEIGPEREPHTVTALVAEDEVLVRMVLAERLRDVGFNVLEAANADEARRILGATDGLVNVVISDVHMARPAEGLELARWVGEHYPGIPVILASGDEKVAGSSELAACENVTDFVSKPYAEAHVEKLARMRTRPEEFDE